MEPIKVLVVEDNAADVKLLKNALTTDFQITVVATIREAKESMRFALPDIVLLDLLLPDSSGTAGLVQLCRDFPDLPIVVWTGAKDAADSVYKGAVDFILKGVSPNWNSIPAVLRMAIAKHGIQDIKKDIKNFGAAIEALDGGSVAVK